MGDGAPPVVAGHCDRCDEAVQVYRTVPWQDDVCTQCGSSEVELHE